MNDAQLLVPEQTVLFGGLALLGLGAVIGPLVIGLAIAAMSIGFALSIGAFALSTLFLPMAFFSVFFMLTFGGFFGSFALLSIGVFLPKVLSLIATGAGLAIGWSVVQMFANRGQTSTAPAARTNMVESEMETSEEEEEVKRVSEQLKDFDQLLAEREHRKRVDSWRGGKS